MDVYMTLKTNYSDLQSNYCKMLKNMRNNDFKYDQINNEIIELSHLLVQMSSTIEDINMALLSEKSKCMLLPKNEQESLDDYNENQKIIQKMMPYYILLKYNSLINK